MRRSAEQGFTLVELLVSLALIGGAAMLLLNGLTGTRRVWDRVEAGGRGAEAIVAAQGVLRRIVEQAYPWTAYTGSRPSVVFDGTAQEMVFIGAAPANQAPSRLRRYHLYAATDGSLRLDIGEADREASPAVERRVLLTRVAVVELGYFGTAPPDNSPRWRERWIGQPSLPTLVRLKLRFDDGAQPWPALVMRPAATLDSACITEIRTGRCRGRA